MNGQGSPSQREVVRVIVERESVNDDSVVVTRLHTVDGAVVAKDQPVLEIETSKTVSELVAPIGGRVSLRASVGDELKIGELIFEIVLAESDIGALDASEHAEVASEACTPAVEHGAMAPVFSLAARRAAQVNEIAPERFAAGSWVTAADVLAVASPGAHRSLTAPPVGWPSGDGTAFSTLEKLSKRKQVETRNLSLGNSHGCTSIIGASVTIGGPRLVRPAALFRDSLADLIVFEGARLLRRFPRLNAYWVDERQIALYSGVNFGLSFDSGDNLKVLAIQGADALSLDATQQEFSRLLDLYESGGHIDEQLLASATVTLSDLSAAPVTVMHPLVNGRQALILGVTHPTAERFELFAGFDHRVSEGLAVARFLGELNERITSHFAAGTDSRGYELSCSACGKPMHEELQLGGRGMLDVTLANGSKGLLCRNCYLGY
jgi:pyruvate/2-oxoglutarate dehydrogenase complex dihydrolipoamide acyltransferase (E2) component